MQPTHENIDRWLFDYTEGNLSAEQELQLEQFLMNHPDLEMDLDAWEVSKVDVAPIPFNNKSALYKKRSYKPTFALLGLLLLFVSGLAYYQTSRNINETAHVTLKGKDNTTASLGNASKKSNASPQRAVLGVSSRKSESGNTKISTKLDQTQASNYPRTNINLTSAQKNKLDQFTQSTLSEKSTIDAILGDDLRNFDTEIDLTPIALRSLKGMTLPRFHESIYIEELNESVDLDAKKVSLGNLDLVRKLDRLLSKEIGLTNNQSYDYTLPGQSNLDVNFSSVGTTSQTRFQAVSSLRAPENPTQMRLNNQLSLDGYSRGMRAGFGLQANYDDFGDGLIKDVNVALIFSPKIALSRKISLEPAIRFNMGTMTLNEQKLSSAGKVEYNTGQVNDFQFDPNLAIGRTLWYRDLDLGMTIHTPLFFLSGQVSNLFKHNENIYTNDGSTLAASRNIHLIAGTQYISRNEKLIFSPYALYQQTKYQTQLFGGFTFKAGKAQIGMTYGSLSSANVSIGYVGTHFALIGQSGYGTLVSTQNRTFTHQITLRIHSSVSKKARRYISL
jgi:uncharacterized protein (UPF0333 family)